MNDTSHPNQEGSTGEKTTAEEIIKLREEMKQLCENIQLAESSVAVKLTAQLLLMQSDLLMLVHVLHEHDVAGLTRAITELQIANAKPL